jgi:hypothetical protein
LEADRRHREEVDRNQLFGVILQESAPGLRRGFAGAHDVFADTTLPDVDAKLEKFAVNAGCTPSGVLAAHLADQISDPARNDRSSRLAVPHLPGPEQAKAGMMPGKDRFWLDDGSAPRASHARGGTGRSTTGGRRRSISGVLPQISEAQRFGGAEPGSRA